MAKFNNVNEKWPPLNGTRLLLLFFFLHLAILLNIFNICKYHFYTFSDTFLTSEYHMLTVSKISFTYFMNNIFRYWISFFTLLNRTFRYKYHFLRTTSNYELQMRWKTIPSSEVVQKWKLSNNCCKHFLNIILQ